MGIAGNLRARANVKLLLGAALLGLLSIPAAAGASTVAGEAPGGLVRFGGKPAGNVLAVDPGKAKPVAGAPYRGDGSYKLTVPKGVYLVLAPIKGSGGKLATARSRIFRISKGQKESVRVTKKTPKRRKKKGAGRRSLASAAAGQLLKVSVHGSTISGGDLEYLGAALDSITVTDLFAAKQGLDCPVEVYVDRLSNDFKAIKQEIAFQRTAHVDPNTRVEPLYNTPRYTPKVRITATIQANGSALTGSIVARKIGSGKVLAATSVNRSLDSILDGFPDELRALLEQLCDPGPPPGYGGPISGTASYDENELGEGNSLEASWSGSVELTQFESPPTFEGGPIAGYILASGSVHYTYSGRVGDCDVAASGPIDLGAQPDYQGADLLDLYEDEQGERSYRFQIPMPVFVQIPATKTNCVEPSENGGTFSWVPSTGIPWLVNAPLPSSPVGEDWSLSGSNSGDGGPGTPAQTWQWSLAPRS